MFLFKTNIVGITKNVNHLPRCFSQKLRFFFWHPTQNRGSFFFLGNPAMALASALAAICPPGLGSGANLLNQLFFFSPQVFPVEKTWVLTLYMYVLQFCKRDLFGMVKVTSNSGIKRSRIESSESEFIFTYIYNPVIESHPEFLRRFRDVTVACFF